MPSTRASGRPSAASPASGGRLLGLLSRRRFLGLLGGALAGCAAPVVRTPREEVARLPLLDAHSHYVGRGAAGIGYTPAELVAAMDAAGIRRMVVLGFGVGAVPALARQYPDRFIPSYVGDSSFRGRQLRGEIRDGIDPREVEAIGAEFETALQGGAYRGVGEIHTYALGIPSSITGGPPAPGSRVSPDSPLIHRLLELAGRYRVPINIHCESDGAPEMVRAVRAHPGTRVVWAHTGSVLGPEALRRLLEDLPNLSFDFSTKTPACCPRGFREHPLTGIGGVLDDSWRTLMEAYSDRLLFGVDFFSRLHLARARDAGEYVRGILVQLPPAAARKIAFENAERLYAVR